MKKTFQLGISLALIFSLALTSFAAGSSISVNSVTQDDTEPASVEREASPIVREDTTKRGRYEKHFLCEDGTTLVASYPEPVHEQNNDGEWIDIDNSLQYENGRIENNSQSLKASFASTAAPQSALTAQSSTKISQQQTAEKLVQLQQGEYALAWSLTGTTMVPGTQLRPAAFIGPMPLAVAQERPLNAGSQAQIDSVQETEQEDQAEQTIDEANRDKMTLDSLTSSVLYEDAMGEGIDVRYTVFPTKVKEDIILNAPSGFREYTMHLDADGLTAEKQEDNSVVFLDESGGTAFTVFPPYMYDNAGADSYDIDVAVAQEGNVCTISFTPDMTWLQAADRAYPVIIDPSTGYDGSNYDDTYVHEGDTSDSCGTTHNTNQRMYAGIRKVGSTYQTHRAYFKIKTLPTLPANSVIDDASLRMNCWSGTSTGRNFSLYKVTGSWNHATVKWNTQPSSQLLQSNEERISSSNAVLFEANEVTRALFSWYTGSPNYGFMVRYTNESKTNPDYNAFYSSNCNVSYNTKRPIFYFSYQEPTKLPNGTYFIRNVNSGHYLDAVNGGGAGTSLCQYNFHGAVNQQWVLNIQGNSFYRIIPKYNSNLTMMVSGANAANKTPGDFNGSSAQHFMFYQNNDGSYRIMTRTSKLSRAVVVKDASTASGAVVYQYDYNGTANEHWWIEPTYGKYTKGKASPSIPSHIATAKAQAEKDYNCWPARSDSNYYGKSDAARHAALTAIKSKATATISGGIAASMPDAATMLLAFTNGQNSSLLQNGIFQLNFKDMNNEWSYANSQRKTQLNEAIAAAEALVASGETANIYTMKHYNNKKDDNSNWHNAVGAYATRVMCTVSRSSNSFQATVYYYLNDYYDWDKDSAGSSIVCTQREMWELHHGGYAKEYEVRGTNKLTIRWTKGQRIGSGASVTDIS